MAVVKSLADGHTKVVTLAAPLTAAASITVLNAATDISMRILATDFDLGPTGSSTIDEKPLSASGNFQTFDASNYGGGATVFRYYVDTTKIPDVVGDAVFAAHTPKGSTLYLVVRESAKASTDVFTVGDEYDYYEVITDDPMQVSRVGYIKRRFNYAVQNARLVDVATV